MYTLEGKNNMWKLIVAVLFTLFLITIVRAEVGDIFVSDEEYRQYKQKQKAEEGDFSRSIELVKHNKDKPRGYEVRIYSLDGKLLKQERAASPGVVNYTNTTVSYRNTKGYVRIACNVSFILEETD